MAVTMTMVMPTVIVVRGVMTCGYVGMTVSMLVGAVIYGVGGVSVSSPGLVGSDLSPEPALVRNVINGPPPAVDVSQAIGTPLVSMGVTIFLPEVGGSERIFYVVPKMIIAPIILFPERVRVTSMYGVMMVVTC